MNEMPHIYKALASQTRLRILSLLLAEGELCVCDIIAALKLPQPTISRHLSILRKTGWVIDRRCGLWIYYSIQEKQSPQKDLLPLLRQQLIYTKISVADREVLTSLGAMNNCT